MSDLQVNGSLHVAIDVARLANWILAGCLVCEFGFLLLDYHVNYAGLERPGPLRRLANIAREDGLASWFATVQTLLIGLTALLIQHIEAAHPGRRRHSRGWLVLSLLFLYLAIDDGAQVHERVASAFDDVVLPGGVLDSFPSYTWQVLFLPVFAVLGLFMLVFLWGTLADRAHRLVLLGAMGLMAFAIALDFVEGLEPDHALNLHSHLDIMLEADAWSYERFDVPPYEAFRHFGKAIEETVEMIAMSLIWFLFLRQLAVTARGTVLRLAPL